MNHTMATPVTTSIAGHRSDTVQREDTEGSSLEMSSVEKSSDMGRANMDSSPLESKETTVKTLSRYQDNSQHLSGIKLVTVVGSLMLAVFCVALDNTSQLLPSQVRIGHY
jgi:hypothetical protein